MIAAYLVLAAVVAALVVALVLAARRIAALERRLSAAESRLIGAEETLRYMPQPRTLEEMVAELAAIARATRSAEESALRLESYIAQKVAEGA